MSFTRALSASLILSTALTMGACKGDNKSGLSDSSPAKALKIDGVSGNDIGKLFANSSRKVSDKDAEQALTKLGLGDKSAALSWNNRSGKAGNYVYTDLTATSDDGEAVTMDKLELIGVRMDGGAATFDILKAFDIKTSDDDVTASFGKVELSGPSPKMAAAITKAFADASKIENMNDLDFDIDFDDEDIYFDAINIESVSLNAEEGGGTLKQLAWGEVGDTGRGLFLLDGLNFNIKEKGKPAVKIKLDSASARGVDMDAFKDIKDRQKNMARGPQGMMGMFSGNNTFAKTFDTMGFKNLDVEVGSLSIRSDGAQGSAKQKGDVTTIKQVLQPLTIKFSEAPEDREMKQAYELFQTLGYDEMVITSAQTSSLNEKTGEVKVENSYLDLKDGFRLAYNLDAGGLTDSPDAANAMENMTLSRLDLSLEDKSILDRAFKLAAKQQGSSAGLLKMQAKGGLMMMTAMAQNEQQQDMAAQLSKAVTKFIDDGGTLKIGVNPEAPIRASELKNMNPGTMDMSTLGFYAKTE